MAKELKEVWLIDYARTPFSRSRPKEPERDVFGDQRGDELLAQLLMKFCAKNLADKGIQKKDFDEFSVGTAMGVYECWTYGGKLPTFMAELPIEMSSFFIDKQCGSAGAGLGLLTYQIMAGAATTALCTGVEHMTRIPMQSDWIKPNLGMVNKKDKWYRPDYDVMTAINMLQTAQKLYEQETPNFKKEDMDKFGVRSQNLAVDNMAWLKKEIIPIEGHKEGDVNTKIMIDQDQSPRKSELAKVAALPRLSNPYFLKQNIKGEDIGGKEGYMSREGTKEGVITPGSSSPLNAGATACVIMEAKTAEKRGLKPMAKILSIGTAGVDPSVMGRGPVPASKKALELAGLKADQIDYWEINEAFCIVALNCMKAFNIPEKKVNIMGGATAIGHPLGSSMVRLTGTLARILNDKKGKYGIATACIEA